jgi:hypothetical protein
MHAETYWTVEDIVIEEENLLIAQGYEAALAIDSINDFACAVIVAKTLEQEFFLKLKFGERLRSYCPNITDSIV